MKSIYWYGTVFLSLSMRREVLFLEKIFLSIVVNVFCVWNLLQLIVMFEWICVLLLSLLLVYGYLCKSGLV